MKQLTNSELKNFPEFENHKAVYEFAEPQNGLHGFIAIHRTFLSLAVGGTRMFPYASAEEALRDCLRLSSAMSHKCALANVGYGGGKGVIIADPEKEKTPELLLAYADKVNELHGQFYTGEDVGLSADDVKIMLKKSDYFIGKPGLAGDPSPFAALGVFYAMAEAAKSVFGSDDLRGRTVAIKGVGKVGGELARLLAKAGAKLTIADLRQDVADALRAELPGVKIVDPTQIHKEDVEIYAPCAMGNDLTEQSATEIRAKIICGGANNQLSSAAVGQKVFDAGILYIPDYIANAGGLINVVDELNAGGYNRERVFAGIKNSKATVARIIALSKSKNEPPDKIAGDIAREIFEKS